MIRLQLKIKKTDTIMLNWSDIPQKHIIKQAIYQKKTYMS
jgi:hypothetical protein